MRNKYSDWQHWIIQNLQLLARRYGKDRVMLNGKTWRSILILYYRLPQTWRRRTSRLLIVLPSESKIFYTPPDRFYMDLGLRTVNGQVPAHYFEGKGYNDMAKHEMARFSFHLNKGWNPKVQCQDGTNLLHIIDGLYKGLDSAARETMQ